MSRYEQLFTRLQAEKAGAFVPFVTLGDPNPDLSLGIIETLVEAGADALELGLPFSDPLADGPTIQQANLRAFAGNISIHRCFEMLATIRQKYPDLPVGLLVYANLVFTQGISAFYARCQAAGVDSVLIADVPLEECAPFRKAAITHDIAPIFICPPDADTNTIEQIAELGQGYTYLVSRAGVTGSEHRAILPLTEQIAQLNQAKAPPVIQGFGISEPEQVQHALAAGAAGAISGSATVKIIEKYAHDPAKMHQKLLEFVRSMKSATKLG